MTTEPAIEENDRRIRHEVLDPEGEDTFVYDFPVESADDLVAYVDDEEAAIASVDLQASEIVLDVPADQGSIVVVEGRTSLTRQLLYPLRGGLPSGRLNAEMNQLFFATQEFRRDIDRLLMVPKSAGGASGQLPTLVAGRALMVNSTANGFEMGPTAAEIAGAAAAAAAAIEARNQSEGFRDESSGFAATTSGHAGTATAAASAASNSADEAAASAAKLMGTSASEVEIATGAQEFVTQSGKFFAAGTALMIVSAANPDTHYMTGVSTAYAGTALSVNVMRAGGTGDTRSDWVVMVSGLPGLNGTGLTDGDKGDIVVQDDGETLLFNSGTAVAGAPLLADSLGGALFSASPLGGAAFVDVIDEDDMVSDSATRPPSQQSVKAYVDAAGGQGRLINTLYYTCPTQTVTISNASPAVFTYPNSGRNRPQNGCPVRLTTTGALPPNFSTGVTYWVVNSSGSTSNLAATKGGTPIDAGGAGSGTHTITNAPHEKGINNPSFIKTRVVGGAGGHNSGISTSGGGGAGGSEKTIPASDLSASETVTSGAAGFGTTNGGTSSYGSHLSATGGESGGTSNPGGTGTGGDINIAGQRGLNLGSNLRIGGMSAFGLSIGAAALTGSVVDGETGIIIVEEYA
ncbi:MAG: hypothetical protein Q8K65_11815 [Alphaproteobacteria bacterium]|nr:hypothetical protein [Alphaproteobacteria bacterium]